MPCTQQSVGGAWFETVVLQDPQRTAVWLPEGAACPRSCCADRQSCSHSCPSCAAGYLCWKRAASFLPLSSKSALKLLEKSILVKSRDEFSKTSYPVCRPSAGVQIPVFVCSVTLHKLWTRIQRHARKNGKAVRKYRHLATKAKMYGQ